MTLQGKVSVIALMVFLNVLYFAACVQCRPFPVEIRPQANPKGSLPEEVSWLLGVTEDFPDSHQAASQGSGDPAPSFFPFESFRDLSLHVSQLESQTADDTAQLHFLQGAEDFSWAEESFELPRKGGEAGTSPRLALLARTLAEVERALADNARDFVGRVWSSLTRRSLDQ